MSRPTDERRADEPDEAAPRARGSWVVSVVLLAAAVPPGSARAGDVEPIGVGDATEVLNGVDGELTKARTDFTVVSQSMAGATVKGEAKVERRIREGELYAILGDDLRASVLLLDVVDVEANRSHPRFDHAQYLLGESLRKLQNYSDARSYLEALLPRSKGERLKQVVFSLIEIANTTKRFEPVEGYLAALRAGGGVTAPEVDYIHGKTIYALSTSLLDATERRARLQQAFNLFKGVPPGTSVSTAASYYAGVCQVALGQYPAAIAEFDETVARSGKLAEQRALRDLARISLGRLYFEVGKVEESVRSYELIGQSSAQFQDMLFEVAWAHVRAAKDAKDDEQKQLRLTKALRMAELLMTSAPQARMYPEARILEGNLQIRLGAPETAYDTFDSLIDRYGGARSQLAELLAKNPDPRQFFDQLVGRDAASPSNVGFLPPVAVEWAVSRPEMRQAVDVLADLKQSETNVAEGKELVDALSRALDGEQRFGVGGLDRARKLATGVENRVVLADAKLTSLERRMVLPYVTAADRQRLDEIAGRRGALEGEFQDLPETEDEMARTIATTRQRFRDTEHRVFRQTIAVNGMRAQLAAVDVWLVQYRDYLSPEQLARIQADLETAKADVLQLERELVVLSADARMGSTLASGDGGAGRAEQLRADYSSVMTEEVEVLRGLRGRLPPELGALTGRIDTQRAALVAVRQDVFGAKGRMEEVVRDRVREVREIVRAEDSKLRGYEEASAVLRAETDSMLGPVASQALRAVSTEFNDLVLKADVGIIDVAWARKQQVTDRVAKVVREQQDRTRELETEFQDVIEGN